MAGRVFLLVVLWGLSGLVGPAPARAEEAVPALDELDAFGQPGEAAMPEAETEEPPLRISLEFQDASLRDVLKSFSQQTGINVITGPDVGELPVTVYLQDVEILDALDQILDALGLVYERAPGSDIYLVRPKPKAKAEGVATETRVYRLKFARVSASILAKAAAVFGSRTPFEASLDDAEGGESSSSSSAGSSGGGSGGSSAPSRPSGAGGTTEAGVGIDMVLKELLTEHGKVVVDGRTNTLIVTDVPENFPRIEAVLVALDIQTPQIMVDSEIIETTLAKVKDLGVEWGIGSEGDLFSLDPATRATRFPFSHLNEKWRQGSTDTTVTSGGIQFGTLGSSAALAVLQAMESDTDTKILARPKVLTLDNESAVIRLTADEAIGFETSQAATGTTPGSKPERTTTGVVLVVTPQVNESDYITMIVEPTVTKTVPSNITPPSGQATPRDPKTRSSRTLVRIKNGHTLIVGGLIDRRDQQTVRKVPVLGDVPVLGAVFRNTEVDETASELLVFITPHIIREGMSPQVASAVMSMREQQPVDAPQEAIERTLNRLEAP